MTALTEKLDHWLGSEITYEFGPESQVVDENVISRFIRTSEARENRSESALSARPRPSRNRLRPDPPVRELKLVKNGKHPQNAWVELTGDGYELHQELQGSRLSIRSLEEQMKGF